MPTRRSPRGAIDGSSPPRNQKRDPRVDVVPRELRASGATVTALRDDRRAAASTHRSTRLLRRLDSGGEASVDDHQPPHHFRPHP